MKPSRGASAKSRKCAAPMARRRIGPYSWGSRSPPWRKAGRCALAEHPRPRNACFGQTLEYAAFPHKSKPHLALGSDVSAKSKAWEWSCEQIIVDALRPERIHKPLFDQLGIHRIGDCRLPVCTGLTAASITDLTAATCLPAVQVSLRPLVCLLELHYRSTHREV